MEKVDVEIVYPIYHYRATKRTTKMMHRYYRMGVTTLASNSGEVPSTLE